MDYNEGMYRDAMSIFGSIRYDRDYTPNERYAALNSLQNVLEGLKEDLLIEAHEDERGQYERLLTDDCLPTL